MIKPEELRIGNCVVGDGDAKKRLVIVGFDELEYAHLFSPIPLTEEWLLKFGFKKEDEYNFIKELRLGYKLRVEAVEGLYSVRINSGDSIGYINSRIKHVHQLQNLYFALTGKEIDRQEVFEDN